MASQTKQLAWFHFQFRIPDEWEITAYSTEEMTGRLEFSTRKGFQARLSWESYKRPPDMQATMLTFLRSNMTDAGSKLTASSSNADTRKAGIFLIGHLKENGPCHAMAWLENSRTLIHWSFAAYDERLAKDIWNPILDSFEPNDTAIIRYAVYGMDFFLPHDYQLDDMTVLPANVMIAFSTKKRAQVALRRWGMPDLLLQGRPLDVFYPWFLRTLGCRIERVEKCTVSDMEAVRVLYEKRVEHRMDRLIGRPWKNGEAWLWFNKNEMRIYAVEQIAPANVPLLKMNDVLPSVMRQNSTGKGI